jgi:hypothetical protein
VATLAPAGFDGKPSDSKVKPVNLLNLCNLQNLWIIFDNVYLSMEWRGEI